MSSPQPPKYQVIYSLLRSQILAGEFPPGSQLPAQQDLADSFGVTLMTLRQAVAALEADQLVWASRGKGTFVADRPVDIGIGNLSSFAQQMRLAGFDLRTEVLGSDVLSAGSKPSAEAALGVSGPIRLVTRLRSVDGLPISLQRSYLQLDTLDLDPGESYQGESLYDAISAHTGWEVAEAGETITAVGLDADLARILETEVGAPAMLSIRTSINQFGQPFLHDEAFLVGSRCTIAAHRGSSSLSLQYRVET